ncbi:glycosyltransferase family 4 protein [Prochlorococcus marinus]|uniref:glycosyltransferase family 4 protein n=1 Tax=Prochlorococcus marinus TaxID=1219 RepID=UPI0022B55151|nr:glycosyltransferase family 4 protein [Prochlorococcus marinus]
MIVKSLKLILISTPIGFLGSGRGGGVELTLTSIVKGFLDMGHRVTLVAPKGSILPFDCERAELITVGGIDQPSWQHQDSHASMVIPLEGVLPKLLNVALELSKEADAILNLAYDWLPLWITPLVETKIFHLISMGGVSKVMQNEVNNLSNTHHSRLAFHTYSQASDYELKDDPIILGNGFDLKNYQFKLDNKGPLGWAGRVAPEKGLEDAVQVAAALEDTLVVWGFLEDKEYASKIEASVPSGTIEWRGYLDTEVFQNQLGACRAFINTPKWNEAYGNVVMEAMACGVPVVAYDRGGPSEIVKSGITGWLTTPDDIDELTQSISKIDQINRINCRDWAVETASYQAFCKRIFSWISREINI